MSAVLNPTTATLLTGTVADLEADLAEHWRRLERALAVSFAVGRRIGREHERIAAIETALHACRRLLAEWGP